MNLKKRETLRYITFIYFLNPRGREQGNQLDDPVLRRDQRVLFFQLRLGEERGLVVKRWQTELFLGTCVKSLIPRKYN